MTDILNCFEPELLTHTSQMQQFCCRLCWWQKHGHWMCPLSHWLSWRWLQSSHNFVQSSL